MKVQKSYDVNKLTRAAILSAFLIIMAFIFGAVGIGYSLYVELVVPIIIMVIYLSCQFKYTVLSGLISIFFTAFVLGNMAGAVLMSQSIIMGIMCGYMVTKDYQLIEDLLFLSLGGCILMLVIDYYFKGLLGISLLDQIPELEAISYLSSEQKTVIFYLGIAAVPISNMLMVYIAGIYLSGRLKLLTANGMIKYKFLKQPKQLVKHLNMSKKIGILGSISIILLIGLQKIALGSYTRAFCVSSEYILLYFMLLEAYRYVIQSCFLKTKKRMVCMVLQLSSLIGLLYAFKFTSTLLLGSYLISCSAGRKERYR